MSLKTLLIRQGERLTLRAIAFPAAKVGDRDDCPVLAFAQEQSQIRPDEWAKLAALLDHTVTQGAPTNETKFKHLTGTDGLFEFKTGGGLRLFGFWDEGQLIICTHGTVKKSQKTDPADLNWAEKMKTAYMTAKKKGTLTHVQPH